MKHQLRIALAALAVSALSVPVFAKAPASITIPMNSLSGSNEDGTATLTQLSDGVQVVIALKNAPATAQPAHIHIGPCGNDTALEYALKSADQGSSTTIVHGATLEQLLASPHSVNVHKSATELQTYVSCGDIAREKQS